MITHLILEPKRLRGYLGRVHSQTRDTRCENT